MPLGTLDRTPPPFFKQGPSALSKLMVCGSLALFLMVADTRLKVADPLRSVLATVLYPLQWLVMQPVRLGTQVGVYFGDLHEAQQTQAQAQKRLVSMSARASLVEQLEHENQRLRALLTMRERLQTPALGAQVIYDVADPFARRVVIDRGQAQGVVAGSPVLDEFGVLGQVTRVHPMTSEVTLLVDRDQAIPVLNLRTGVRNVAYGLTGSAGDGLELRFTLANADIEEDDLLTTSGVDGVYPPGLPVARVLQVERRAESSFARILCTPLARMQGTQHVLVLTPIGEVAPEPTPAATPTGRRDDPRAPAEPGRTR